MFTRAGFDSRLPLPLVPFQITPNTDALAFSFSSRSISQPATGFGKLAMEERGWSFGWNLGSPGPATYQLWEFGQVELLCALRRRVYRSTG